MPPRALLFDLDGTLVETDSVHFPAWADILAPSGYEVDWAFYQENISGRLNPDIVEEFLPHLSKEEGRALLEEKEADFRGRVDNLEPLPGLLDFISFARDAGLALALVTNAPKPNARAIVEAIGLAEAFDPIILAEDVGSGKPHPAPYLAALERLGVSASEALAFEDSRSGIASSVAAGIPTVGIASTHDPKLLEAAGAFIVADDFTDQRLRELV